METQYQSRAAKAMQMPQSHSEPEAPKVDAATTASGLRNLKPHVLAIKYMPKQSSEPRMAVPTSQGVPARGRSPAQSSSKNGAQINNDRYAGAMPRYQGTLGGGASPIARATIGGRGSSGWGGLFGKIAQGTRS